MRIEALYHRYKHLVAVVAAASVSLAINAQAADLTGAGGTAIYPVLSKWASQHAKKTGTSVTYQPVGSSAGLEQMQSRAVMFANSDMPLVPDNVAKNNLVQFPQVIISIEPVVHIAGVNPGDLVLDGPTLANVYLTNIKFWDDPAIKKLNPTVHLPHQAITTVYRSDGSGTTFNFTNYLSKVSRDWKSQVGQGTTVSWPAGVGGIGNSGVASFVAQVDGAIGYVEDAYAIENKLAYADMINKAGKRVRPTMAAFQAATADADFTKVKDFYLVLTDRPGAKSWPITAATYMLLHKDGPPEQNHQVLQFLHWALTDNQAQATARALGYVPLPDAVVRQIERHWASQIPAAWKSAAN